MFSFVGTMPEEYEMYYGFTRFAMELNELDPDMAKYLPITDTRFRPDQRYVNNCLLLFVFNSFISSTWWCIVTMLNALIIKLIFPNTHQTGGWVGHGASLVAVWKENMLFLLAIEPNSKSSSLLECAAGLAFLSSAHRTQHMHKHSIWTTEVSWKLF